MTTIILHIGVHRTGTTSLQALLRSNAEPLAERAMVYPQRVAAMGAHHPLAWALLADTPSHYPRSEQTVAQMAAEIRAEAEAAGSDRVLLSSEDFCLIDKDQSAPSALLQLRDAFAGCQFQVVIALRNQLDFVDSYLRQAIQSFDPRIQPMTAEAVAAYFAGVIDYQRLIDRWAEVFGMDNLVLINYDDNKQQLYSTFLRAIGLDGAMSAMHLPALQNASASAAALRFKHWLNQQPLAVEDKWYFEQILSGIGGERATLLSAEQAAWIAQQYTDKNERLNQAVLQPRQLGALQLPRYQGQPLELTAPEPTELALQTVASLARLNRHSEEEKQRLTALEKEVTRLDRSLWQASDALWQQDAVRGDAIQQLWDNNAELYRRIDSLAEGADTLNGSVETLTSNVDALTTKADALTAEVEAVSGVNRQLAMFLLHTYRQSRRRLSPRRWLAEVSGRNYRLVKQAGVFDAAYYCSQLDGSPPADPLRHFFRHGAGLGLNPAPWFNTLAYLCQHPEVATTGVNPLVHYLQHSAAVAPAPEQGSALHVLVIDHELPRFDENAGARHTFQYLQLLVDAGYQVTFLPFIDDRSATALAALADIGVSSPEPPAGEWQAHRWAEWIQQRRHQFGLAIINRPHIAAVYLPLLRDIGIARIWYMCHDLHFLRLSRQAEHDPSVSAQDVAAQRDSELMYIGDSDLAITPSEFESELLQRDYGLNNVVALPLYVYDSTTLEPRSTVTNKQLLFVGSFAHQPNVDAMSWFLAEIWPRVRSAVGGVQLTVVGKNPPPALTAEADQAITFAGYVDDDTLAQLYQHSALAIMPLRFGAGVKGKVLEAMYYGTPIVATGCALEGIPGIAEVVDAADSADAFAAAIIAGCNAEPAQLAQTSAALQAIIAAHFSRAATSRRIAQLLQQGGGSRLQRPED